MEPFKDESDSDEDIISTKKSDKKSLISVDKVSPSGSSTTIKAPPKPKRGTASAENSQQLSSSSPSLDNKPQLPPLRNPVEALKSVKAKSIVYMNMDDELPPPLPKRNFSDAVLPIVTQMADLNVSSSSNLETVTLDYSKINRIIPNENMYASIKHKGSVSCIAFCNTYVCTGHQSIRVYDIKTGENVKQILSSSQVFSMCFQPSVLPEEDGRILWVGLVDGMLMTVDMIRGVVLDRRTMFHTGTVLHLLRHGRQVWSLDDTGSLHIWSPPVSSVSVTLEHRFRSLKVSPKLNIACICLNSLWLSNGKYIEIIDPLSDSPSTTIQKIEFSQLGGNTLIGNLTRISWTANVVITGHDDGKILLWDRTEKTCKRTVSTGSFKISCLVVFDSKYLWVGFSTGKINIFEISKMDTWVVIKEWKAHSSQVSDITLDQSCAFQVGKHNCASVSDSGLIQIWDVFLSSDYIENEMSKLTPNFCTYKNIDMLIVSWNVNAQKPGALEVYQEDSQLLYKIFTSMSNPDIIVVGLQEIVDLGSKTETAKTFLGTSQNKEQDSRLRLWQDKLLKIISEIESSTSYALLASHQLVGILLCVLVKETERRNLSYIAIDQVKTGLGGLHGNKGSIVLRLIYYDSSFCFMNCHLAAGQSRTIQRNSDAAIILSSASLPAIANKEYYFARGGDGTMTYDHENMFFFGDLNYRIDLSRKAILDLLQQQKFPAILEYDQLTQQFKRNTNFYLRGFKEAPITFSPTYKYDIGTSTYDTSEKQRTPAYCDRILYFGENIECVHYQRYEAHISDHRPISAGFNIKIKQVVKADRDACLNQVLMKLDARKKQFVVQRSLAWLSKMGYFANDIERTWNEFRGSFHNVASSLASNNCQFITSLPAPQ